MTPTLYRGQWPQNVSKLAKYAVRFLDGTWKVTVQCAIGDGLRYLAVEGTGTEVADRVNEIKRELDGQPGGAFYINEYRHLVIPVTRDGTSHYFCGGTIETDFVFEFEGRKLTTRPIDESSALLKAGDRWIGPRPGIPYVLAAGGGDIYYETPALTDTEPPSVRSNVTRKVLLSKQLGDRTLVARAVNPVAAIRGHQGGRFYVNEHGAMFTPINRGDGNGLDYVYCGQIDRSAWFPEPRLS